MFVAQENYCCDVCVRESSTMLLSITSLSDEDERRRRRMTDVTRSARDDNAAPSGAGNLAALSKEHRLLRGYRKVVVAVMVAKARLRLRMMTVMMRFSRSPVSVRLAQQRTRCSYPVEGCRGIARLRGAIATHHPRSRIGHSHR